MLETEANQNADQYEADHLKFILILEHAIHHQDKEACLLI